MSSEDASARESQTFGFADLFAGIGGFAAVLKAMGGEHAYAVEIDRAASQIYSLNWQHEALGDVTKDANDEVMLVPDHAVVAGGFPCQPFSKSGAQRGMDEVRGTLFFHIEKILRARKPTLVVLENVRNLVGPRHRHEWEVIIDHLRDAGYQVSSAPAIFSPHKIAPEFGGSPQVRERVFITATLVPEGHVMDPEPAPVFLPDHVQMHREWDLLKDLPVDHASDVPGTEISADERAWIDHWEVMVQIMKAWRKSQSERTGEPLRRVPGFPIWTDAWVSPREHERQLDGAPAWKADFLRKNFDLYSALREFMDPRDLSAWLKSVRLFPESRRKLEWQAQDAASIWDCVISFRPSGLRVKRPTHLPALVAITQTPVIGPLGRKLSAREAARLQGLPDGFSFGNQRDALTFKQMGNGVNVGVVWNVLKAHVERDKDLLLATEEGQQLYAAISGAPTDPRPTLAQMFQGESVSVTA
ncbi:DNA (cytosine-5-)-methyltransferase [Demequina capsici]|uniref:DNA (cytosine-5-)-methyltransferase n=1 Tax=Demequina capsici TaxID=3075620 RepID=A0AA96JFX8_9MICO|nr:DNA (cytosine-5-)-methyltransferase [Demequina sp. PMTSA13]WNM27344.1 DNA (cytosine-5-)-methyltransferase [Demequina sp. PMTSA13]